MDRPLRTGGDAREIREFRETFKGKEGDKLVKQGEKTGETHGENQKSSRHMSQRIIPPSTRIPKTGKKNVRGERE